ncbi:leucine-rich repeat domain-containing protein [Treponema denticola]|uniref:leucine-rich repeat domain-containing protein n=1 Tax=Treponema denticola TaxID=158 RepID=UPI0011C72BBD|nr:leucine-rich repeat domain-containing protein [Treponema denticola]
MKKHKGKILVLFLAVLLVSVMSCENPFLKKMLVEEEKGKTVPEKPHAPFVEGGASLILSPDKLDIKVKVTTADSTPVTVEGCTETELTSGTETVLQAKGRKVILKGNITGLYCGSNQLTALNVQGLSALRWLDCDDNQLTTLNVQGLTALKELICGNNQLTELNVQGLTALQGLGCYNNQLTALNVQGLTALQGLSCGDNQLTALNVQGLTALKELWCVDNQLTELNVQGCTALYYLICHDNQLTTLDVQGLTALRWLSCGGNQLTALNVQGLPALKELGCGGNQLTELNVQGLTALESLYCGYNQLTSIDVQGLTALRTLDCCNNQLNADAFKKLFTDLPQITSSYGGFCVLYTERTDVTEGNHTDFTAPQDLKDAFDNAKIVKKWKMYKRDGSGSNVEI